MTTLMLIAIAALAIYFLARYAIGAAAELHRIYGWPPHRTSRRSFMRIDYGAALPPMQIEWVHPIGIWSALAFLAHLAEPGCTAELGPLSTATTTEP